MLLKYGPDETIQNLLSRTAFDLANVRGKQILRSYGTMKFLGARDLLASMHVTELLPKLFDDQITTEELEKLLNYLRDANRLGELNQQDKFGNTILHTLAPRIVDLPRLGLMKCLIQYQHISYDLKIKNRQNQNVYDLLPFEARSSIITLAFKGKSYIPLILQDLVGGGAGKDINALDHESGRNIAHRLAALDVRGITGGYIELFKLIFEKRPNLNVKTTHGETVFDLANPAVKTLMMAFILKYYYEIDTVSILLEAPGPFYNSLLEPVQSL